MLLTKSDFKVGHDCLHKLKYKKAKYPSKLEVNEYMSFFADCGFMVEALAHALHPDGSAPTPREGETLADATSREFAILGDKVWFEPTFTASGFSARIDMMIRTGNVLELIEIKAKSFDPEEDTSMWGKRGGIRDEWESYLIDVTFQTMVTRLAHPSYTVIPKLFLVDLSTTCTEDALYDKIELIPRDDSDRSAPRAKFRGDVEKLRQDHMLKLVDVSEYVDHLMPEVEEESAHFLAALNDQSLMEAPPLSADCKKCEYRDPHLKPSGFSECWGELALVKPHVLDMYYASSIGGKEGLENLVRAGSASALDINESTIDNSKATGKRQLRQIRALKEGREQTTPDLASDLSSLQYPLFFMDFETSRIPVPYHADMNPYEQICFQFSCHVIESKNSTEIKHFEWLNLEDVYPSFEFAKNLQRILGEKGTIIVWSPHEQTAIKEIVEQASKYGFEDEELLTWLSTLHRATSEGGRIFDLMRLCERGYYHPEMNGRVGLKFVLKAIWQNTPWLWNDPWFAEYLKLDESGNVMDPYQSLSIEPFQFQLERLGLEIESVREGVGAMRTYQDMLYGLNRGNKEFQAIQRDILLQYCKLDTAAMVIIWKYWMSLIS